MDIAIKHRQQQVALALEEVIETAAVGVGTVQYLGNGGIGVTLLPEQVRGRFQDAVAGVRLETRCHFAPLAFAVTCLSRRGRTF
jgi:hypothetical protein